MKHSFTVCSALLLAFALVLSVIGATPVIEEEAAAALLQLAAGNHVLGFDSRGVYAAGASHALRVDFVRANKVEPQTASGESFQHVVYAGLWDGISLEYASLADGIYATTYTLAPGADAKQIRLRYNAPVALNENGTLTIAFENGAFTESAPIAWQTINGARVPLEVAFRVRDREVGFALGAYDPQYGVTIDPSLTWNTFLGSSSLDWGYGIARDGSGNLYVTGYSAATWGSPVRSFTAGGNDCFVAKLDASGYLLWNTFLGSSGSDECRDIVYNGSEVLVTGLGNATWASPVRAYSSGYDTMVAKLNASTGALIWNSFLGGSGADYGRGISFANPGGYVYVSGYSNATWGTAPKRSYTAGNDGYAAKLDSTGALVWHAFLGGSGTDYGRDIYALSSGAIYAVGYSDATWSAPTLPHNGGNDAYIVLLDSNGLLSWLSFLGGSGDDYGIAIHVPSAGAEYVLGGSTATWGSPVRAFSGVSEDVFIARVGASGTLTWNTFLGSGASDTGYGITTNNSGEVYATGVSYATWGSPLGSHSGVSGDVFAAKVNSSGGLVANTFFGSNDYYESGHGIVTDSSGDAYVAGPSGATWGSPVRTYSADDVFVAKVDMQRPTVSSISYLDSNPTNQTSVDYQVNFSEPVTDVLISDFGITTSGLSFASISSVGCAGSTCTVAVNTGTGDGTLYLRVMGWADIYDLANNLITGVPYSGPTYTVDKTAPTIVSITRANPSPTGADSVDYTVTFSESVTGVSAADFSLTASGLAGASVSAVNGSGATRTVTVATGSGSGTIRLDIPATATITDAVGNSLGGLPYTSAEVYTVNKPTPTATFTAAPTNTATATLTSSPTPTFTPTNTGTVTATSTHTSTPTVIPTSSCTAKPGKPQLAVPQNGKMVKKSKVFLDWGDVTCADSYKVLVRLGSKKGTKVVNAKILPTSQHTTKALTRGQTYYWRASACSATYGCSNSAWQTFTIKP